jgi:hypothetical protein
LQPPFRQRGLSEASGKNGGALKHKNEDILSFSLFGDMIKSFEHSRHEPEKW